MPTLDEFLANPKPPYNLYVRYPGFKGLYVRKNEKYVRFNGTSYRCHNVVTLANITARHPGKGAFKGLVKHLVSIGKAVYVESVLEPWFQNKLIEWGYTRVDEDSGHHYLFNYEGHFNGGVTSQSTSASSP